VNDKHNKTIGEFDARTIFSANSVNKQAQVYIAIVRYSYVHQVYACSFGFTFGFTGKTNH